MKKLLVIAVFAALLVPAVALAQDPPKPETKAEKVDVSGVWDMIVETPQGQMNLTATFKQDGEKLTGTQASPMGEVALEGTVVGNEIKYTIVVDMQGQQMSVVFGGKVEGDSMSGIFEFGGMGSAGWSAKKRQ
jgi:hypothetical protein